MICCVFCYALYDRYAGTALNSGYPSLADELQTTEMIQENSHAYNRLVQTNQNNIISKYNNNKYLHARPQQISVLSRKKTNQYFIYIILFIWELGR